MNKAMRELRLKMRAARTIQYGRSLDGEPWLRKKMEDALERVLHRRPPTLIQALTGLTDGQWRVAVQCDPPILRRIPDEELVEVLARFKAGHEAQRSIRRLRCKKWNIDTTPAGWTQDRMEYNRQRYRLTRGGGKRLDMLYQVKDVITGAIASEAMTANDAKGVFVSLLSLVETAIASY